MIQLFGQLWTHLRNSSSVADPQKQPLPVAHRVIDKIELSTSVRPSWQLEKPPAPNLAALSPAMVRFLSSDMPRPAPAPTKERAHVNAKNLGYEDLRKLAQGSKGQDYQKVVDRLNDISQYEACADVRQFWALLNTPEMSNYLADETIIALKTQAVVATLQRTKAREFVADQFAEDLAVVCDLLRTDMRIQLRTLNLANRMHKDFSSSAQKGSAQSFKRIIVLLKEHADLLGHEATRSIRQSLITMHRSFPQSYGIINRHRQEYAYEGPIERVLIHQDALAAIRQLPRLADQVIFDFADIFGNAREKGKRVATQIVAGRYQAGLDEHNNREDRLTAAFDKESKELVLGIESAKKYGAHSCASHQKAAADIYAATRRMSVDEHFETFDSPLEILFSE